MTEPAQIIGECYLVLSKETDEELAARYRRLREECLECYNSLTERGYQVYTVAPSRVQINNEYGHEIAISKQITKEL